MKDDSAYRSLTETPGWLKKICTRCEGDFWLAPGQDGNIIYCQNDCRHEPPEVRLWKNVIKKGEDECWNCSFTPSAPYPTMKVNGKTMRVCRFVLEIKLGRPIAKGLKCLHSRKCGANTKCVNPNHLREGTQKENIQQAVEMGTLDDRKGAKCPYAKLTEEQAKDIKFNPLGLKGIELAAKHGVSKSRITTIQQGKSWPNLQP